MIGSEYRAPAGTPRERTTAQRHAVRAIVEPYELDRREVSDMAGGVVRVRLLDEHRAWLDRVAFVSRDGTVTDA